jgi:hypothetical protein
MPTFKSTNIEMVEMFKKSFHVQVKARRDMVVITSKKVLILEYQSMITLFMTPNAQLNLEETCEYFKICKVENLQKLQMRLNVGLSHATSRTLELNMVFPSPIKTTKQNHIDVFN